MAPWALYVDIDKGMKRAQTQWGNNPALVYGQLKDHADINTLSAKIRHDGECAGGKGGGDESGEKFTGRIGIVKR
jgi:hypothetical protein